MSILRKQDVRGRRIEVGARVQSRTVGRRLAFIGEVVEQVAGGFNVLDDSGQLWLRSRKELSVLQQPKLSDHQS